ncbi:MAG TPA: hypothetical protein VJ810_42545 [Blastocatellia bacterium]|nr:hypothetical protein [Blastocatellia bacterium]
MFKLKKLRFALLAFALALVANLAVSEVAFAKQRRGDGHFRDKKAEKFINGHDARDGRWDGRGPRFRDRRDRDERFRFRDRRDRDELFRDRRERAEFRRDQWRRAEMRRAEWRRNELLRRRNLPRRRF